MDRTKELRRPCKRKESWQASRRQPVHTSTSYVEDRDKAPSQSPRTHRLVPEQAAAALLYCSQLCQAPHSGRAGGKRAPG